jgi:hypothetical protein
MKICTKCKQEKDESEFYKDTRRAGKLQSRCKTCRKNTNVEYSRKRRKIDQQYRKYLADSTRKSRMCKSLKQHHVDLQFDPDHLTTEFLQNLIGIKCKTKP